MKFSKDYRLRTYDTDMFGFMKPLAIVQYMQEAAEHHLREFDKGYDDMYREDRRAFILSRMNIEIYDAPGCLADITASTWFSDGKAANFPRCYEIKTERKVIARACSNWALINVDTKRLILNNEYHILNHHNEKPPMLSIPARFRIPKDIEMKYVGSKVVGFTEIDINKHMNNTKYFNVLYDLIPNIDKMQLRSMNIRYVHEAPYCSEMKIFMSRSIAAGEIDPSAEYKIYFRTEIEGRINVEAVFGVSEKN